MLRVVAVMLVALHLAHGNDMIATQGGCGAAGISVVELVATADASVSEQAPDTNSGGRKLLTLRKGQEPGRDEESFILFDITSVPISSLGTAQLSFEVAGAQKGIQGLRPTHMEEFPFEVREVALESHWSEYGLTWGTKPTTMQIAVHSVSMTNLAPTTTRPEGYLITVDVTKEVKAALARGAADRRIGFELRVKATEPIYAAATLYSREDGIGAPPTLTLVDGTCKERHSGAQAMQQGGGEFHKIPASMDTFVRSGPWMDQNFGREPLLYLHNGEGQDNYASYVQFPITEALRDSSRYDMVARAEIKLLKWQGTSSEVVEDIVVHHVSDRWDEHGMTATAVPAVSGASLDHCTKGASLSPEDPYLVIDITDYIVPAIQVGDLSFTIRLTRAGGTEPLKGIAPLAFYAKESGPSAPVLLVHKLPKAGNAPPADQDLW